MINNKKCFDRDILKLKSQWVRVKVSAGKVVASVKRASVTTGNSVFILELSAGDDLVQSRISYEFIEGGILIDSNNQSEFECMEIPRAAKYLDCEILDKTAKRKG